jgi:predicted histone-like DNA-binding protein
MSIMLNRVQRGNPADPKAPKKWYAVQHVTQRLDEVKVSQLIADETTLDPFEALMAIRLLRKVILSALLNGQSVELGGFGFFSTTLHSSGADTKDALTASYIKGVKINFEATDDFKAELQKADFVWLDKIDLDAKTGNGGGGDDSGGDSGDGDLPGHLE